MLICLVSHPISTISSRPRSRIWSQIPQGPSDKATPQRKVLCTSKHCNILLKKKCADTHEIWRSHQVPHCTEGAGLMEEWNGLLKTALVGLTGAPHLVSWGLHRRGHLFPTSDQCMYGLRVQSGVAPFMVYWRQSCKIVAFYLTMTRACKALVGQVSVPCRPPVPTIKSTQNRSFENWEGGSSPKEYVDMIAGRRERNGWWKQLLCHLGNQGPCVPYAIRMLENLPQATAYCYLRLAFFKNGEHFLLRVL